MNKNMIWVFSVSIAMLFGTKIADAALLQVDANGILTGAKKVDVGGVLYDVEFKDGSCNSLFNNCDSSMFAFQDFATAISASQALLNQVFVNSPLGAFDDSPALTNGCSHPTVCDALTPYNLTAGLVAVELAANYLPSTTDTIFGGSLGSATDTAVINNLTFTYAVWTQSSPVPEPGTLASMALGLAALRTVRHRRS